MSLLQNALHRVTAAKLTLDQKMMVKWVRDTIGMNPTYIGDGVVRWSKYVKASGANKLVDRTKAAFAKMHKSPHWKPIPDGNKYLESSTQFMHKSGRFKATVYAKYDDSIGWKYANYALVVRLEDLQNPNHGNAAKHGY